VNRSHESTGAPGDLLPARWFDGLSSKAQPVMVGLQPTPKGPSLLLHPMAAPGAAPRVFTHDQVVWPQAWSAHRSPRRVVVDLRDHGSLEIDAGAVARRWPRRCALAWPSACRFTGPCC
jgi:hypothetical protein